mmetsp:Transcript_38741/g.115179  ORF Transcript_38741/g.115179 Transcript_38741/m.115179 type:complete len:325 (-) Transcript_38741:1717-2691(-)
MSRRMRFPLRAGRRLVTRRHRPWQWSAPRAGAACRHANRSHSLRVPSRLRRATRRLPACRPGRQRRPCEGARLMRRAQWLRLPLSWASGMPSGTAACGHRAARSLATAAAAAAVEVPGAAATAVAVPVAAAMAVQAGGAAAALAASEATEAAAEADDVQNLPSSTPPSPFARRRRSRNHAASALSLAPRALLPQRCSMAVPEPAASAEALTRSSGGCRQAWHGSSNAAPCSRKQARCRPWRRPPRPRQRTLQQRRRSRARCCSSHLPQPVIAVAAAGHGGRRCWLPHARGQRRRWQSRRAACCTLQRNWRATTASAPTACPTRC